MGFDLLRFWFENMGLIFLDCGLDEDGEVVEC